MKVKPMSKSPCWNIGTIRRVGWAAFIKTYSRGKWLISHLPPTFAITIHIPQVPVFDFHASLYLTSSVPIPHVPASHTWCPQVLRLASPSPKSPHTRPNVPVPLSLSHFYTQPPKQRIKQWSLHSVETILTARLLQKGTIYSKEQLFYCYK